jgi:hypothetical protein
MRIGRSIIIPAILALGASGSILVASTAPVAAAQAPSKHVHPTVFFAGKRMLYHA